MSSNSSGPFVFDIDDTDPRLQYSGEWFTGGEEEEFHNTTHGTSVPGSAVTFSFNGTFVSASFTVDENGVQCAYSLDGQDLVTTNQSGFSPPSSRFPLITVPDLDDKEHNLTIISRVTPGQTLWLDSLSFTGHSLPPVPPFSSPVIFSNSTAPSHHGISPGVIAAIVLGALLSVAILAFMIFYASRRWHRLRIARPQQDLPSKERAFEITPSGAEQSRPRVVDAIAVKIAAGTHNGRSAPSHGTTLPSSVFSSVIFNTAYSSSNSSRGPLSV